MVTEPVVPVEKVLGEICMEGMVIGWRAIAQGLIFLHSKVGLIRDELLRLCGLVECVGVCLYRLVYHTTTCVVSVCT